MGVGGATLKGFKKAYDDNYKTIIKIDGDGQHETKFIKKFYNFLSNNYDFCKGYRDLTLKNALHRKMPIKRFIGAININFKISCDSEILKMLCMFFGIKSSFFGKLKLKYKTQLFF